MAESVEFPSQPLTLKVKVNGVDHNVPLMFKGGVPATPDILSFPEQTLTVQLIVNGVTVNVPVIFKQNGVMLAQDIVA
jgi:hypothetical protein